MQKKHRVLFVDDEPRILGGLRRMLRAMRHEWDMDFASGGREALDAIEAEPPDVIVSDMSMPGMDGVELLTEVKRRHPQIVRVALSGQCSRGTVLSSVGVVHQYQAKPCEPATLKGVLARVSELNGLLTNDQLRQRVSSMPCVHSLPHLRAQLTEQLESPDASAGQAASIISQDLGLSAKVTQFVSSTFFAKPARTLTPAEAASFLGLDILRALALSLDAFADLGPESLAAAPLEQITEHSRMVAECAQALAVAESFDRETTQEAFLAGLFHDIGKVVLAQELPEQYAFVGALRDEQGLPEQEAERRLLGATHCETGAFLMGLWGLPPAVVKAVASHHDPSADEADHPDVATIVRAANAIVHGKQGDGDDLERTARPAAWNELCRAAVN